MKKFLYLITVLCALSASVFAGCGSTDDTNGDSVAEIPHEVAEDNVEEKDGSGFDLVPRILNGKAVTSETGETAPDIDEKPQPEKHKRRRRRQRKHDGELYIIRFKRIFRGDDIFRPIFPIDPVLPEDPEAPAEPDENGEN